MYCMSPSLFLLRGCGTQTSYMHTAMQLVCMHVHIVQAYRVKSLYMQCLMQKQPDY